MGDNHWYFIRSMASESTFEDTLYIYMCGYCGTLSTAFEIEEKTGLDIHREVCNASTASG